MLTRPMDASNVGSIPDRAPICSVPGPSQAVQILSRGLYMILARFGPVLSVLSNWYNWHEYSRPSYYLNN